MDAAGVDEAQAVLDAGAAIRDFGEIVFAQLFLFFHAKGAVIGGDNLERIARESLPEFFLMPFFAERWSENVFCAFKAGSVHIFEREIQILWAGFGVDGDAAVAGFANFFERVVAGEMNDVDGGAGHFCESDSPGGGFGFGGGGAGESVILGSTFPFGKGLLDDDVDRAAVFGVHADETVVSCGLAHGFEDGGVIQHEHAGVGHEEFEAGDTFADELGHFLELRGAEIGDDAVEGVVGNSFIVGLFHPGIERLAEALALVLDGEIDERSGAAEGCGDGAGLKIVGAGGAAEGHVEVGVHVDAAGDDEHANSVDDAGGVLDGEASGDGGDLFAVDAEIGDGGVGGGDDGAVTDYGVKAHEASGSREKVITGSGLVQRGTLDNHKTHPLGVFVSVDSEGPVFCGSCFFASPAIGPTSIAEKGVTFWRISAILTGIKLLDPHKAR